MEFINELFQFERMAHMDPRWQGIVILLAVVAVSIAILSKGADWLVEGGAQLAYRSGISKIIVGATVVSLGTTAPEAAVSVLAAFSGNADIALGNAVGSVICDTGLIFGLSCVLTRLPVDKFILNRHGWLQFGSGVLLVGSALLTGHLTGTIEIVRGVGVLFLILLVGYMFISVRWARQHPTASSEETVGHTHTIKLCLAMILGGVVLVVFSAQTLIGAVQQICLVMGVPRAVVSATVVAFGTSLPELVTAITSIRKGHPEILIGNIIGADILNVLFVIGASALTVQALAVPDEVLKLQFPAMLAILLMFRIFIFTSKKSFSRWCGVPLLAFYVAFIILSYVRYGSTSASG